MCCLELSQADNNFIFSMKKIMTLLLVFCTINLVAQTSMAYLQDGISKQQNEEYTAAINSYTRAIALDANSKEAFYNRGVCKLILKDQEAAIEDFTQVLNLDSKFIKAYYSRATAYVGIEKFQKALPDLSKAISLDPKTPNALTLRGQIRAQTGNQVGACEDFNLAKQYGDQAADKYIKQFCTSISAKLRKEQISFQWPKGWKVGDDQENKDQHVVDYIPKDENIENWTELINTTIVKNVVGVPMDKAMNLMFDQFKTTAPDAKLTFIEKEEQAQFPWILFAIESPRFVDDETPESQLWYVVQGKKHLYLNFRAIKKDHIPKALLAEWKSFFNSAKVILE